MIAAIAVRKINALGVDVGITEGAVVLRARSAGTPIPREATFIARAYASWIYAFASEHRLMKGHRVDATC